MIIPLQFGFSQFISFSEKKIFEETTNMIKAKLDMNAHWMVLYKL
jgi:hypothetical protein